MKSLYGKTSNRLKWDEYILHRRPKGYESTEEAYLSHLQGSRKPVHRKDTKRIMKNNVESATVEEGDSPSKANAGAVSQHRERAGWK